MLRLPFMKMGASKLGRLRRESLISKIKRTAIGFHAGRIKRSPTRAFWFKPRGGVYPRQAS